MSNNGTLGGNGHEYVTSIVCTQARAIADERYKLIYNAVLRTHALTEQVDAKVDALSCQMQTHIGEHKGYIESANKHKQRITDVRLWLGLGVAIIASLSSVIAVLL